MIENEEEKMNNEKAVELNKKKSNWKTSLLGIVLFIMIVLLGLYFAAIEKLFTKVNENPTYGYVDYRINNINKRIDDIQNQLINKALVDINATEFQEIDDNLFLLVRDVKPYSTGYKFTFGILNKSGIDMSNLKFVIKTNNITKEFTLNGQLKNQYLNNVDVIIPNTSKDDLSNKNWYVQFINASYSYYDMTKTNK